MASLVSLRDALADAGFDIVSHPERDGLLAEDDARVAWCKIFPDVRSLLSEWQDEQAWFVEFVARRVETVEKTWELYLVLASELEASEADAPALELVRKNSAYARKLIVAGLASILPTRLQSLLDPLRPLPDATSMTAVDALDSIEERARLAGETNVLSALRNFRNDEPLF